MHKCDGCGVEFDESVALYPRLVVTQEVQVARRLAEKEEEEMLCLGCWLDAVDGLEKRQLAMLLLAMLQKIDTLQNARLPGWNEGVVEKSPRSSYVSPYPAEKVWVGRPNDGLYVGDPPSHQNTITVCRFGSSSEPVYVAGGWGEKMQ